MRIGAAKQSYAADTALFDTPVQRVWVGLGLLVLLAFPFVASEYWLYLACLVAINVASTMGLNILTGYTGLVSLGQAAFMGLGAYTVAVLQIRLGTPMLLNLVAGRCRGHGAGRARRPAFAACEGAVPGHRDDCRRRHGALRVFAPGRADRWQFRALAAAGATASASRSTPRSACTG